MSPHNIHNKQHKKHEQTSSTFLDWLFPGVHFELCNLPKGNLTSESINLGVTTTSSNNNYFLWYFKDFIREPINAITTAKIMVPKHFLGAKT